MERDEKLLELLVRDPEMIDERSEVLGIDAKVQKSRTPEKAI